MIKFLELLSSGEMTEGEKELAYNLTVIYGMSILSMVVVYKLFNPGSSASAEPKTETEELEEDDKPLLPSPQSTLALIKTRRSITPKDLSGEPLTREEVEMVLEAANWAPTHKKNEPWRYTVMAGPEKISDYLDFLDSWYSDHKEEISEASYNGFNKKLEGVRKFFTVNASHVVVISMVREAGGPTQRLPEWEEISAVASSVQNLHLALTSIPQAGGFWSSHTWCKDARDSAEMREYLGLSDPEDRVFGAFVMGRVEGDMSRFRSKRGDWREKVVWMEEEEEEIEE